MYRTTSVMALGLFLGLAPIGALAQTQTDDTDTQLQTTQPSDTQQSTDTETTQSDDQQSDVEVDLEGDDTETTDTQTTTGDDAEVTTDTQTTTGDDAEVTTDTQTTTGDDAEVTTDTQTTTGDDTEMTTDTDTQTTTTTTETEVETTTDDDAEMTTDDDTATDDEADVAATDSEEVPEVIPEQDTSEMLGSSLMGASVNLADEEIGNVSDLIIDENHQVRGVVVGVGGFLGIGEKRVALPVERLTIQATEPGEVEISTDMTREELEEKEAFKTAAQVRSEEEAAQAQQEAETQQPMAPTTPPAQ